MANIRGHQYVLHNPSPEHSAGETDEDDEYETQKNLSKFMAKIRRKSTSAAGMKRQESSDNVEKHLSIQ